jgi:hypothetical protein
MGVISWGFGAMALGRIFARHKVALSSHASAADGGMHYCGILVHAAHAIAPRLHASLRIAMRNMACCVYFLDAAQHSH